MGRRILIVDDSTTARMMISHCLGDTGCELVEARDGREALTALGGGSFDLVITDLSMPNMSGIELIREVRKDSVLKEIPILMLTTEGQREAMEEGRREGATGWVVKPFEPEKLCAVVKELLP